MLYYFTILQLYCIIEHWWA